MKLSIICASAIVGFACLSHASIFDDFNDGNDTGWSRQSPLTGLGSPAVFNFPGGNSYQIIGNPQGINPAFGPARAGSLRLDETYTQFFQTVDIVDWDSTKPAMVMGMLARITQPGLGTTDGYSLTITLGGSFDIYRITDEQPLVTPVATLGIGALTVGQDYRLVFSGVGDVLTGQIYNLANLATPIATISGSDATYASGNSGLLVFSNSGTESTSATFDNYYSSIPEPSSVLLLACASGMFFTMRRRAAL